ncbi:hypothetical protein GDO86_001437 [Hymenochirus boettgeri]|uniref:Uncharacterized protein n=1 Tax=Hymenochirus boettgeri TaxID=247094 RepID=A0A8T2KER2_9PIPI|nr:hypothetical protein GDO86_001437 [Hymenochirus boettgeri]
MENCNSPDLLERKGSLYLRSHHMQYDRATLVSGWHKRREAEPKDYDLTNVPSGGQNLCRSTYERFGDLENADWKTVTEEHLSQINLKKDYEPRDVPKLMVNENTFNLIDINQRQTSHSESVIGKVLPRHAKDHRKMHLKTTYNTDYTFDYMFEPMSIPDVPDYSAAYKKCHSQFTDTADYRRHGRNTWQDESGIYSNKKIKGCVFERSCPITLQL